MLTDNDMIQLDEASINRVIHHIINSRRPFIVVSAFKSELPMSVNMARHRELKRYLSENRDLFGFIEQEGAWGGIPEKSIMIIFREENPTPKQLELFRRLGEALMKKFEQEAIIFSDGSKPVFLYSDGRVEDYNLTAMTFDPEDIEKIGGYSEIKGKRYALATPDVAELKPRSAIAKKN